MRKLEAIMALILLLFSLSLFVGWWRGKTGSGNAWTQSMNEVQIPAWALYSVRDGAADTIKSGMHFGVQKVDLNDATVDTFTYDYWLPVVFDHIDTLEIEILTDESEVGNDSTRWTAGLAVVADGEQYTGASFTSKSASIAVSTTDWTSTWLVIPGWSAVFSSSDARKSLMVRIIEASPVSGEIDDNVYIKNVKLIGEGLK